jgi:hypothetical protein
LLKPIGMQNLGKRLEKWSWSGNAELCNRGYGIAG